jgi:hypothetical protein
MAAKSERVAKPPIVLMGGLVEQVAVLDRTVTFRGHGMVLSDGVDVGPVPRLALIRDRREILLILCTGSWKPISIGGGGSSVRVVKKRAERMYQGVSQLWRSTHYTRSQAKAVRQRQQQEPGARCSVCKKYWYEVRQMITAGKPVVSLCDECVRELHSLLQPRDEAPVG